MTEPADDQMPDAPRLDAQLMSDLWIFRGAARFGSITAAATRLGVTQGAVSQRVLRLEGRLGLALFTRKKSRLTLTEAGARLLDAMNDVALRLNDTLSRFDTVQRTSLVVSCVPSLATEWLVPRLTHFYDEHPNLELFVRAELAPTSAERMEDEGIDVLIQYQEAPASDLHELATLREMIVPVCSRRYRERMAQTDFQGVIQLHDDIPWHGGPADFEWATWAEAQPGWTHACVGDRHFNLAHLAYHAAMAEQGVAIGRAVLVNRLMQRGELVPATDLAPVPGGYYRILALRPGNRISAVRQFAAWVARTLDETQSDSLAIMRRETHGPVAGSA